MNQPSGNEILKKTFIALKKAEKKAQTLENAQREPIAIIGMGCRFPGGCDNPDLYWDFLKNGKDACIPIPEDRWDADTFYDPSINSPGTTHASHANFLTCPINEFDAHFFNISGKETLSLDPQQRLLLEVTWEAFENAGIDISSLMGSRTGVYVGISSDDYTQAHRHSGHNEIIDPYSLTGTCFAPAAGRISYTFGFEGPSMAVDTACSSSLVALHLACQGLRNNESDTAIAGGVNLMLSPIFHICSTKLGTISPDGKCKTFDASGDGYGRGEGCGIIVLKRLSDAQRDGDRILALIKGAAVNQDGKSNGLTAPNGLAQEKVIRKALANAGLTPNDIDYIEAHGTGTKLGDPIEVESIGRVIKESHDKTNPLILCSVKSNIGHLEAASGISGVIKMVLSIMNKQFPPHLNMKTPNPLIPWDDIPVRVPQEITPWPKSDRPRRAGINSFGFSGTNVHIILEEPSPTEEILENDSIDRPLHLLPITAKTQEALTKNLEKYQHYLENTKHPLSNICHTASVGRNHLPYRTIFKGQSKEEMLQGLQACLDNQKSPAFHANNGVVADGSIVFLFTGQGSQYTGMGRELFATQPVFRQAMQECNDLLAEKLSKPLLDLLYGENADDTELSQTGNTQPAIFAIQYALAKLWTSWGVSPDLIAGHSIGEYAAACYAGVMSLEDAIGLVAMRGRLMQSLPKGGSMSAVFADENTVRPFVDSQNGALSIAACNAPENVVISGDENTVESVMKSLKENGISSKPLVVSHAFHSSLMEPILDEFEAKASMIQYKSPQIDIVSTVTGKLIEPGDFTTAKYWTQQIRKPVRFCQTAQALAKLGGTVFIEIGSMPTLTQLTRRSITVEDCLFLPSLKKGRNDWEQIGESLAKLYCHGAKIDWQGFDKPYKREKVILPNYSYHKKSYYMNPVVSSSIDQHHGKGMHPYLGERISSSFLPDDMILYNNVFTESYPGFLNEHHIFGNIISPGAAHLCMALSAWRNAISHGACVMENVSLTAPLTLKSGQQRIVQMVVKDASSNRPSFQLTSKPDDAANASWITHCQGEFTKFSGHYNEDDQLESLDVLKKKFVDSPMTQDEFIAYMTQAGYEFGPNFKCVREIYQWEDEVLCLVVPVGKNNDNAVHPGLIDSLLQTVLPAISSKADSMLEGESVLIPLQFGQLMFTGSLKGDLYCHTCVDIRDKMLKCKLRVMDSSGATVLMIKDFLLKQTDRNTLFRQLGGEENDWLYSVGWEEQSLTTETQNIKDSRYILFSNEPSFTDSLKNQIQQQGGDFVHVVEGDSFKKVSDSSFATNLSSKEDIQQLVKAVSDQDKSKNIKILYAMGMDYPSYSNTDSETLVQQQTRLSEGVYYLVQALESLNLEQAHIWIITRQSQMVQPEDRFANPYGSSLWGLGRTLVLESPLVWGGMIDVDEHLTPEGVSWLLGVLDSSSEEREFALRKNKESYVSRLHKESRNQISTQPECYPERSSQEAYYLDVGNRGSLDELSFKTRLRKKPGLNEMEVKVYASGLNFRDVLNTLGQYPGDAGFLGYEASGVITEIGEGITDFAVGEPVIVMDAPGCICDYITCHRNAINKKPPRIGHNEAVTIPATFLTAYYALIRLAKITKEMRILIHAGTGGVGMAAIQIARDVGAELYATAGTEEKRALLKELGVKHVFSSRTLDFAEEIMQITNGDGVHVVLNSLANDFIEKSFSVLCDNGKFLEIGKKGIWTDEQVKEYNPTLQYDAFDLAAISRANPEFITEMYAEVYDKFVKQLYEPLPISVFPMEQAKEAFRFMAQAKHIGKVVLSRQNEIRQERIDSIGSISPDATYLVTGGLGALGLNLAEWLAEEGAGAIVLTGRSGIKPAAEKRIKSIQEKGIAVHIKQADIADREDVQQLIESIEELQYPLKGVIHAAGVLDDGMGAEQDGSRLRKVMLPKIQGTYNLHQALMNHNLDFMVLFSSVVTVIGNLGQSNYAAANGFMDGFAHYLQHLGYPCKAINWGPWAEAGMAATVAVDRFSSQGIRSMPSDDCLRLFKNLLSGDTTQPSVLDVDWPTYAKSHNYDSSAGLFANLIGSNQQEQKSSQSEDSHQIDIIKQLEEAQTGAQNKILLDYLVRLSQEVLGYSESELLSKTQPLADQGFDSLMTVDIRNRLSKKLNKPLPVSLLFDYPTLEKIADFILTSVLEISKPESTSQTDQEKKALDDESVLQEIEELIKP